MILRLSLILSLGLLSTSPVLSQNSDPDSPRPNVLFIIVDDANPYANSLDGGTTVPTPHLEKLAARSTRFTRAYVNVPACAPSRTALLSGVAANRSGAYYNNHSFRESGGWIAQVDSLPQHFKKHGYLTAGYGKVFHFQAPETDSFSEGHFVPFTNQQDSDLLKSILPDTRVEISENIANYDWGQLPNDWDLADPTKMQQDTLNVERAIQLLQDAPTDQALFVACGIYRPHVSWTVPQRYFDLFPLDEISIPDSYRVGDLDDLPKPARWIAMRRGIHTLIERGGLWKKCLQAHYASMAYADDLLGRLLDGLAQSPRADNTVIVFVSDNGFHLGEKNHWSKFALWEIATKVPLMIAGPGIDPQTNTSPVSSLDIYPTLVELAALPQPSTHDLDGLPLGPILHGKRTERSRPVLMTHGPGNHALRTDQYRYIRYRNGDEELYDHSNDPWEWINLADDPVHAPILASLRTQLPDSDAPQLPFHYGDEASKGWASEAFNTNSSRF